MRGSIVNAERIREELKKERIFLRHRVKDVYLTVSIGLAQYKKKEDIKVFVNRADHLMYQGKKNGKRQDLFGVISSREKN